MSNDNYPEKYIPRHTGSSRGVTSYLNQAMIVIAPRACEKYGADKMKSADLYVNFSPGKPEVWVYLYREADIGKFKVNQLNNSARISIRGFASYYDLDLPHEKSAPFDLREISVNPPIDGSFKVLPDVALAFTWPKIENPMPKVKKKIKDPYKRD